jgi:4a-hydroxytetrahydrobiopterin dehydratase
MQENKLLVEEDELRAALNDLSGWEYDGERKEISRVWKFGKFVPTMVFVRKLTEIMDAKNHHSDLNLNSRTKTLTVTVTTHTENAVTKADLDFARAVNASE